MRFLGKMRDFVYLKRFEWLKIGEKQNGPMLAEAYLCTDQTRPGTVALFPNDACYDPCLMSMEGKLLFDGFVDEIKQAVRETFKVRVIHGDWPNVTAYVLTPLYKPGVLIRLDNRQIVTPTNHVERTVSLRPEDRDDRKTLELLVERVKYNLPKQLGLFSA